MLLQKIIAVSLNLEPKFSSDLPSLLIKPINLINSFSTLDHLFFTSQIPAVSKMTAPPKRKKVLVPEKRYGKEDGRRKRLVIKKIV